MRPDIVALGLAGLVFIAIGIPLAVERVPMGFWIVHRGDGGCRASRLPVLEPGLTAKLH